jgi:uncharacterized protein with GYD domain
MIFITLGKLRKKPTKEAVAEVNKIREKMAKEGMRILSSYWTLGRYDTVMIFEAPDERAAMKAAIGRGDIMATETLVAVPREEALKLVE